MPYFAESFQIIMNSEHYELIKAFALGGAILKNVHNVIHLWVASLRIVSLDVK